MNHKMTGEDTTQITHEQLYARIGELIEAFVRGWVFIETGLRWADFASSRLQAHGVKILEEKNAFCIVLEINGSSARFSDQLEDCAGKRGAVKRV